MYPVAVIGVAMPRPSLRLHAAPLGKPERLP